MDWQSEDIRIVQNLSRLRTYNGDTVIVNVCNFVQLLFQVCMISLWPD